MALTGWVLAGLLAALSLYLALRRPAAARPDPSNSRVAGCSGEEAGGAQEEAVARRASDSALQGVSRYVRSAVLEPLEEGLGGGDLKALAEDATDALRDLAFYARGVPEATRTRENLSSVIQEVAREYTRVAGIPVKFSGPNRPVPADVAREGFKDALFLLLENAGRFGGGQTVEVRVQDREEGIEIRVRDRGPGFGREARLRALEPFWTTESDALGLGLPYAKRLLETQGGSVAVGDREDGGEIVIILSRSS